MEIKSIWVHKESADVIVRGLPYARTRHLVGRLSRKQNEVCLILEIDDDDERPAEEQALITISPAQVLRTRTLITTNKSFPASRFDEVVYHTNPAREERAPLTCRWKMRVDYRGHYHRTAGRWYGGAMLHMTQNDQGIKRRNLGLDEERTRAWRGEASAGLPVTKTHNTMGTSSQDHRNSHQPDQTYSFADILCGPGGISRGAEMAGLKVVAAVDPWLVACDTYTANFPDTRLYEMDVTEFVETADHPYVDILHISPNLQHRQKDDETNVADIRAFSKLIGQLRPRVLTMDLNPVMASDANTALFGSLIQLCTTNGYSVQWKTIPLVEFGLPQLTRKRLFIIGAEPGAELPPWPTATHSSEPEGEQKPYMTVKEAICDLDPEVHKLHNLAGARALKQSPRLDNFDRPLNGTMPMSGTPFVHPTGRREFTLRELASFHGFPTEHHFEGSYIKKQIGYGFPPSVAGIIFRHIHQWLKRIDGVVDPPSSAALETGTQSTDACQREEETQVKESTGHQDRSHTRGGSHDQKSTRHGSPEEHASLYPRSTSGTPTIVVPQSRSISPLRHMRQTSSQTPESPRTPSNGRKSGHYLDRLVTDTPSSTTSTTGPGTPILASSHRAISTHKKHRHAFYEALEGEDVDALTTETFETPSKRPRY